MPDISLARILLIEDEETLRTTVRKVLSRAGHDVTESASLGPARTFARQHEFDLVLTDIMLGSENGLDFVKELRDSSSAGLGFEGPVVVMTAFSSVDSAVQAMRLGADDYLQKPLSLEELTLQIDRWLSHSRLERQVLLYQRLEQARQEDSEIIGVSASWTGVVALASKLAGLPLPSAAPTATGARPAQPLPCILLIGETGAGKGVLARHLHYQAESLLQSSQAVKTTSGQLPFIHVNCSALPANLVEGELFGHERGAFTDARDARPGLFEMAGGGTIFLDEISEMPLELQAKLLLVVENGRYRRVGGGRERQVRARVIAATNQDLPARVAAGQFRRDLLYRLNAFTIRVPALREREDDSLLIADRVLERLAKQYSRNGLRLSADARRAIRDHDWPGNTRELVNAIHRAAMLAEGPTVEPEDLGLVAGANVGRSSGRAATSGQDGRGLASSPGVSHSPDQGVNSDLVFDFDAGLHKAADVERELIMQALRHTRGNVSRAAKLIGMQRSSLRYRIDRYRLDRFVLEVANS